MDIFSFCAAAVALFWFVQPDRHESLPAGDSCSWSYSHGCIDGWMAEWLDVWMDGWFCLAARFLAAWLTAVGRAATEATETLKLQLILQLGGSVRYDHTTCQQNQRGLGYTWIVAPVLASNCKSRKHVLQMDFMFSALCFSERISCHGHVWSSIVVLAGCLRNKLKWNEMRQRP